MKRLRLQFDLERLRTNMSAADGRPWSDAEVRQWLSDAGFTPSGQWWIGLEKDLGQLEPEEVTAVEEIDSVDGR